MKKVLLVIAMMFISFSVGNRVFAVEESHMEDSDEKMEVAIDGYCPVCIVDGMMVKGDDAFHAKYKGKLYKFPGEEQKVMFWDDPDKYVDDIESKYMALKESTPDAKSMPAHEDSHHEGSH